MKKSIEVKGLEVSFGSVGVINDVSFEVKQGETFGLLGSNGSGKTTIIRSLLGIYTANQGELLIDGEPYSVDRSTKLGYLPEERGLYKKEKVLDTMVYFGQLKGMDAYDAREWSLKYLERVQLADKAKKKIDTLSGGQQQKVQLGVTIMSQPDILILDEPTKGFDPVNRQLLMEIIQEQKDRGATVVLVTHDMAEVERLCDRVILLKDGTAAEYGTVKEIRKKYDQASMHEVFVSIYGHSGGEHA